jgi:predicted GNAT family acetyltransferase
MADDTYRVTIVDKPTESRFVATVPNSGAEGELIYARQGDRFVLVHTGVPDQLGGHGIAGRLVEAALERAEREHLIVVPWCPYARQWLSEHEDRAARVKVDWTSPPPAR